MAKGRMLSKQICVSEQVDELSTALCQLAFTWSITHLDKNGCLPASPKKLKGLIFPLRVDVTVDHMKSFVDEWVDRGLVLRYSANGDHYLAYPSFTDHQVGLRREKEGATSIPPPPAELLASKDGRGPE